MGESTHPVMGVLLADSREALVSLLYGFVYLVPTPSAIENHQTICAHRFLKLAGCRFRAHEREFLSVCHTPFYPPMAGIFNIRYSIYFIHCLKYRVQRDIMLYEEHHAHQEHPPKLHPMLRSVRCLL